MCLSPISPLLLSLFFPRGHYPWPPTLPFTCHYSGQEEEERERGKRRRGLEEEGGENGGGVEQEEEEGGRGK